MVQARGTQASHQVLRDILKEVQNNMVPRGLLKEWALHTFLDATDYWIFRKTVSDQSMFHLWCLEESVGQVIHPAEVSLFSEVLSLSCSCPWPEQDFKKTTGWIENWNINNNGKLQLEEVQSTRTMTALASNRLIALCNLFLTRVWL